jgi:hypothetical protein
MALVVPQAVACQEMMSARQSLAQSAGLLGRGIAHLLRQSICDVANLVIDDRSGINTRE